MSPTRRRDAVRFPVTKRRVSERRACQVVGQHRSTQRYERVPAEDELRLVARMKSWVPSIRATAIGGSGRCCGPRAGG